MLECHKYHKIMERNAIIEVLKEEGYPDFMIDKTGTDRDSAPVLSIL